MHGMRILVVVVVLTGWMTGRAQQSDVVAAPVAPAAASWYDKVAVRGDLRYRFESVDDESRKNAGGDVYTQERDRIRARLGADAKFKDSIIPGDLLKAGVELSTGGADPASGNQTLSDGFGKKEMRLSLGYVDYAPVMDPHEVHLIAGKMKHPFVMVSDLIWDTDVMPDGVAVQATGRQGMFSLLVNGCSWWVVERATEPDAMLAGGQVAVKMQINKTVHILAGASIYRFDNLQGYPVVDWANRNNAFGNSTADAVTGSVTSKVYRYDYRLMEYFAEAGCPIWGIPVKVFAQMVSNEEAPIHDAGYQAGIVLGKARDARTAEMGYSFQELEKDAVVGAFADADRFGGGADGQGHKVYVKYQVSNSLQLGITAMASEKKISDPSRTTDYHRYQMDISVAF